VEEIHFKKVEGNKVKEIEEYFYKLRFDENFHLGLGDIRLTIAMQEEIIAIADKESHEKA